MNNLKLELSYKGEEGGGGLTIQLLKFPRVHIFYGGRERGGPMRGLGADHVISGPASDVANRQTHGKTDIMTI